MRDRLLQPFTPELPQDIDNVRQFNALTRVAWGMRIEDVNRTQDHDWQNFQMHTIDARPYAAQVDTDSVAVATRLRFMKFGRSLEICTIAVAPDMRSQGLGTRAMRDIIDMAEEYKASTIKVNALTAAIPFYEANGFTRTEKVHTHASYMQMDLSDR